MDKEITTEDNIDEEFMENEMERLNKVSKKRTEKLINKRKNKKANKIKENYHLTLKRIVEKTKSLN